jgi:superfamily II RNA helicase
MGYNFAEAFEPEKPYEELFQTELESLQGKFKIFIDALTIGLIGEDPDVVFLVQSQFHREFYLMHYEKIEKQLNFLQEKSEELIESPDANKPDVLAQREDYARQINILWDIQTNLQEELAKAEQDRLTGDLIAPEKHARAQVFIKEISKTTSHLLYPPTDLK